MGKIAYLNINPIIIGRGLVYMTKTSSQAGALIQLSICVALEDEGANGNVGEYFIGRTFWSLHRIWKKSQNRWKIGSYTASLPCRNLRDICIVGMAGLSLMCCL